MKSNLYLIYIVVLIIIPFRLNAQKLDSKIEDTLFFKLDTLNFTKVNQKKGIYYLTEVLADKGSSEKLFFKILKKIKNLRPKEILNIKEYIHSSEFYYPDRQKNKIYDFGLNMFFEKKIIFLVDSISSCTQYIQVYPMTVIE